MPGKEPTHPVARARLLAVAEALARIDAAIEQLSAAARGMAGVLPASHTAVEGVDVAGEHARVARAKVAIVLKRMP